MGGLSEYSGLTTKVRAMKGRLIKPEEYKKMVKLQSVDEFIAYLKTLGNYEEFLSSDEQLHRGEFEKRILNVLLKDIKRLYKFANQKQRKFLNIYITKYEIMMLKKDVREMEPKELLQKVSGTPYYQVLSKVYSYGQVSAYDYELALDLFFFKRIWDQRKKHFKGKELRIVMETFGTEADVLNIMWIYRAKKYYNMTPSEIYNMTIPVYYKLRKPQVLKLAGCEDLKEFRQVLEGTFYKKYIQKYDEMNNDMEKLYKEEMKKMSDRLYKDEPYSMAVLNSYLREKNAEMEKLIVILESIRYKRSPEDIEKCII